MIYHIKKPTSLFEYTSNLLTATIPASEITEIGKDNQLKKIKSNQRYHVVKKIFHAATFYLVYFLAMKLNAFTRRKIKNRLRNDWSELDKKVMDSYQRSISHIKLKEREGDQNILNTVPNDLYINHLFKDMGLVDIDHLIETSKLSNESKKQFFKKVALPAVCEKLEEELKTLDTIPSKWRIALAYAKWLAKSDASFKGIEEIKSLCVKNYRLSISEFHTLLAVAQFEKETGNEEYRKSFSALKNKLDPYEIPMALKLVTMGAKWGIIHLKNLDQFDHLISKEWSIFAEMCVYEKLKTKPPEEFLERLENRLCQWSSNDVLSFRLYVSKAFKMLLNHSCDKNRKAEELLGRLKSQYDENGHKFKYEPYNKMQIFLEECLRAGVSLKIFSQILFARIDNQDSPSRFENLVLDNLAIKLANTDFKRAKRFIRGYENFTNFHPYPLHRPKSLEPQSVYEFHRKIYESKEPLKSIDAYRKKIEHNKNIKLEIDYIRAVVHFQGVSEGLHQIPSRAKNGGEKCALYVSLLMKCFEELDEHQNLNVSQLLELI